MPGKVRDPRGPRGLARPARVASGDSTSGSPINARAAAVARPERRAGSVLELDLDRCKLVFSGVNEFGQCPATGTPCYQTFGTCKAKPSYVKGTYTWKFMSRGMPGPVGEGLRPYIEQVSTASSELDPSKGLAVRSQTRVMLADEPCPDTEADPYALTTRGGYALQFDGTGAKRVTLPAAITAALNGATWTITGWATSDDLVTARTLLGPRAMNSGREITINAWHGAGFVGFAEESVAIVANTQFSVLAGEVFHYAYTYDGVSIRTYKNGALVNGPQAYAFTAPCAGTYTLSDTNAAMTWQGKLDGVRIYARALSALEIARQYQGAAAPDSGLVASLEFDEGTGVTAADSSGGGNAGALVNAPAWVPGVKPIPAVAGTFWGRMVARTVNAAGRFARLKRGFVVTPWDWATFLTELYIVESIAGPDEDGKFEVVLSDALRFLDRTQIPVATDGKLAAALPGVSFSDFSLSGTANTIVLPAAASSVDDFYNGQEVFITGGQGAGQRRAVLDYVGVTRTVTVTAVWGTNPDATSFAEITPLQLTLEAGKGELYPDPATTGKNEYARIGEEVVRYTAKAGDVLSWSDGSMRAQFGTTRADHKIADSVQLSRAWIEKSPSQVVQEIISEGGLETDFIDVPGLLTEEATWLNTGAVITACITTPERSSDLLKDLLLDLNLLCWWDAVAQKVKFKADMPQIAGSVPTLTDDEFRGGRTRVLMLDKERVTRAAIFFDPRSATANLKEAKNFARGALFVDTGAEGPNEYGDIRSDTRYSRWLSAANVNFAGARVARKVGRFRDVPRRARFQTDPRNSLELGDLFNFSSRRMVDPTGAPATVLMRVVKKRDELTHIELEARTTNLGRRYAFIAPDGYPDYAAASSDQRSYAFISSATGQMSDGTDTYRIS